MKYRYHIYDQSRLLKKLMYPSHVLVYLKHVYVTGQKINLISVLFFLLFNKVDSQFPLFPSPNS